MPAKRKPLRSLISRSTKRQKPTFDSPGYQLQRLNDRIEDLLDASKLPLTRIKRILHLSDSDYEALAELKTQLRGEIVEAFDHIEACDSTTLYLTKLMVGLETIGHELEKSKYAMGWSHLLDCLHRFRKIPAAAATKETVSKKGESATHRPVTGNQAEGSVSKERTNTATGAEAVQTDQT
jgi:hypothetical protein